MDDKFKENTVATKDASSNDCVSCRNRIEENKKTFREYWLFEMLIYLLVVFSFVLTEVFMTSGFTNEDVVLEYSANIISKNALDGFFYTILSYIIIVGVFSIFNHLFGGNGKSKSIGIIIIELSRAIELFGALIASVILAIVVFNIKTSADFSDTLKFISLFFVISIVFVVSSSGIRYWVIEKTHILNASK